MSGSPPSQYKRQEWILIGLLLLKTIKTIHPSRRGESLMNKMPAILALRVMLGLIHLFQRYVSPIDKTILANGIV